MKKYYSIKKNKNDAVYMKSNTFEIMGKKNKKKSLVSNNIRLR